MRKAFKFVGLGLLGLVMIGGGLAIFNQEKIARLMAVNSLFSEDKIVQNFSNMDAAFLSTTMSRGDGPVSDLAKGTAIDLWPEVQTWVAERHVTSLLIAKSNQIVFEDYYQDTQDTDRRISWSVAKSFLSALMGILVADGTIASIDDPVTVYAPSLKGSAYDGATIKNVLQMSSGVTFDEDYLDPKSDINKMGRVLALGGSMDGFTEDLTDTFTKAGTDWQYVSIDTHVLGMVIRGATGRSIADLLGEKIIAPLGLEADPYYLTDGYSTAFVLGGLNLRTRDYMRFGLMIANGGEWNGSQIVPADWIENSTKPSAPTDENAIGYGYQWWVPWGSTGREFMARGVYGQYIYFDLDRDVVIATTAADRQFRENGVSRQNVDIFRLIARNL